MFLLLVGRTFAATFTVGPSGDYATVAEAEAVAASGDTIALAAGVYIDALAPGGRDLTYVASGDASIRAGGTCLSVEPGTRIGVEGIAFVECGIVVSGGALDARDVVFSDTTCARGCGIAAEDDATVTVTGGRFVDNVASGYGGSLSATSGASITLTDTTFSGGSAARGGAIAFDSDGALTLDGVTITGASAQQGGGLWAAGGTLDLVNVVFTENVATGAGGGAWLDGGGDLVRVEGARFVANTAGGNGGGLASGGAATLEVTSSAFLANTAAGAGAGLYSTDSSVWIAGSVLLENDASSAGGGVYASGTSFEAENVALACNTAGSGGGVYVSASDTVVNGVLATVNVGSGLVIYTSGFTATDNLSWGNTGAEWGGVTDPTRTNGNLWLNPRVRAVACDGDWTTDDLAPSASSALVSGADAVVDADGSVGDIGGYGGAWGGVLDVDDDGATYWAGDCHEGRADTYPGATEVWYDGTDQDCDG
ncbi:MAG: right-handed parallel beta-helix repeat-containing protein, partial [Myxococcota bacterium]